MDTEKPYRLNPAANHPEVTATGAIAASGPVNDPTQLPLLDQSSGRATERNPRADWMLDESTKSVGRQGIETARAALRSARRRQEQLNDTTDPGHRRATAA